MHQGAPGVTPCARIELRVPLRYNPNINSNIETYCNPPVTTTRGVYVADGQTKKNAWCGAMKRAKNWGIVTEGRFTILIHDLFLIIYVVPAGTIGASNTNKQVQL